MEIENDDDAVPQTPSYIEPGRESHSGPQIREFRVHYIFGMDAALVTNIKE